MGENMNGDFTIEGFFIKPAQETNSEPKKWTHVAIFKAPSSTTSIHHQEEVEGELYFVSTTYNEAGLLLQKTMTHASLVNG
jgi:hypothetical protein